MSLFDVYFFQKSEDASEIREYLDWWDKSRWAVWRGTGAVGKVTWSLEPAR
jgi:hypothetical protein